MNHHLTLSRRAFRAAEEALRANKAWTKKVPMVNTARPMSPASRVRKWIVLIGLSTTVCTMSLAQTNVVPEGGEFAVSGAIPGNQIQPALAFGPAGGLVVCDDNASDPSGRGITGFRLNAALAPVGGPFRINQTLIGDQQRPRVAALNDGGMVVVWENEGPGPKKGVAGPKNISARFLDANGTFITDELVANQIAYSIDHRITTNWVLIRNNKARPRTQKIREIIKSREEFNANPTVITLNDGNVVVVYSSSRTFQMKSIGLSERLRWDYAHSLFVTNRTRVPVTLAYDYMQDVYAQRFSPTGAKLGDEIVVNRTRDFNQRNAGVAALSSGGFVVCWINELPMAESRIRVNDDAPQQSGGRVDVFARVFGADGTPAGDEFRVSTATWASGAPVVAGQNDGGFTIAWVQRDSARENGLDIWFRSFDGTSTAVGVPVRANTYIRGDQFAPAIAAMGGRQLLVWSSMGQDGSWEGVYARVLDGGAVADDEFRVNTTRYLRQINPAVGSSGTGAIIVWSSYGFDSGFDLFGQRYRAP